MDGPAIPQANGGQQSQQPPKRGLLLRILYRIYVNYLGVTPPTPAQERTAAVVLIAGVLIGLAAVVGLVFFLWGTMARMGGQ